MNNKKYKIAVLIAGPYRYVNLVKKQLEIILRDYNYDCFYHLWKEDLGNKKRDETFFNFEELLGHNTTKQLILQKPYPADFYKDTIGIKVHQHAKSSVNAVIGMFLSMNILLHNLKQLPDYNSYTHILRLRTDCAIINSDFASKLKFDKDIITVSSNFTLEKGFISDHICFASVENFLKLWYFKDIKELYHYFEKGQRSPELLLPYRYNEIDQGIKLNEGLVLYKDYYIVYTPPKWYEPEWIQNAINNYGVKYFFENWKKHSPTEEELINSEFYNLFIKNYDEDRERLKKYKDFWEDIKDKDVEKIPKLIFENNSSGVAIFGTSIKAFESYSILKKKNIEVVAFIDNDKNRQGQAINGITIKPGEWLNENENKYNIILTTIEKKYEELMKTQLSKLLNNKKTVISWKEMFTEYKV